jgi:hypothetical protein
MTDVIIVLAPWVIFAAALLIVLFQVRWPSRHRERLPRKHADPLQMHQPRPGASEGEPPVSSEEPAGPSQREPRS